MKSNFQYLCLENEQTYYSVYVQIKAKSTGSYPDRVHFLLHINITDQLDWLELKLALLAVDLRK